MGGGDSPHRLNRRRRVRQRGPARHAAPVVADDHRCGEPETLDHPADVEGGRLWVVSARCLVACTIAAEVHGRRAEASLVERWDLVAPCPPELTKSVE